MEEKEITRSVPYKLSDSFDDGTSGFENNVSYSTSRHEDGGRHKCNHKGYYDSCVVPQTSIHTDESTAIERLLGQSDHW